MKKIYILLFLLTLSFTLLIWHSHSVSAQSPARSFAVSPPSVQLTLKPGQKTERSIKITNLSEEALEITANVLDFIVTDKEGTPQLMPIGTKLDNKFSAAAWSTVYPDKIKLAPRASGIATLYLQVPGNARPGGRYVSVAFSPVNTGKMQGTGAAINTVIGSLVYLTVSGKTTENARVTEFSVPPFSEYGPITLTTEIQNLGDIHESPRGTVEVKNLLGRPVFSAALDNFNIFPGTSRIYKNTWERKILLGRFQARLSGYYGQTNNLPLVATATFWVVPYKLLTVILLAIVIVVIAFWYLRRQRPEEVEEQTPPAV